MVYNATRFEEPVLISTNLGDVVAGANCDTTFHGKELGFWDIQCASQPATGDESERSSQLRRLGTSYALDHIGRLPVVIAARVARVFEVYQPHPVSYGPQWISDLMLGAWYALVPVAIAGAVVLRRRRTTLLPLVATISAATANVVLTWARADSGVPIDVAFLVLAAVALDAAIGAWRPARARRAG